MSRRQGVTRVRSFDVIHGMLVITQSEPLRCMVNRYDTRKIFGTSLLAALV
jgi:hypothetical protein